MASNIDPNDKAVHVLEGLGHLDQGITIFDQDLHLIAWNQKFLDLLEYPSDLAWQGADFADFIRYNALRGEYGPGEVDDLVRQRVEVARTFQPHRFERIRPDGTTIQVAGNPLPAGGFVSTYTDMTERARRQEELEETLEQRTRELLLSEERLSLIADEVPAGIAHIDRDLKILYANKRFARAYQKSPSEVIGKYAMDVLHKRTMSQSSRFFEQSRRGILVDFEMQLELPGGRVKDIRTLLRPDRPVAGEVTGFYLVSIDVTRRKATMSALMRSQKMDALGRMASGISHDFNNLLTIILGNLVPLSEQIGDPVLVEEFLTPAISAARRGSALTKRLLTLARREQFDPVPIDISEAVEEIAKLLSSSIPSTLKVKLDQAENLPKALVDHSQLEMAILNLTLNARDATQDQGTITIETTPYEVSPEEAELTRIAPGDYVRIRFSDDGCGMAPELVEKIFEPFFTSKVAGSGSGLGLPMVYGFVRQSNGAISVESQQGVGTTFTLLLPCAAVGEVAAPPDPPPRARAPLPVESTGEMKEGLVLLVEDDVDVRRTVRRKIAGIGHPIVEASSGDEAWALLNQIRDVAYVVSDIDMPGEMNGIDLARRIQLTTPDIHVVLMSGKADETMVGAQMPGVAFLKKPFSADQLRDSLMAARATETDTNGIS